MTGKEGSDARTEGLGRGAGGEAEGEEARSAEAIHCKWYFGDGYDPGKLSRGEFGVRRA